MEMGGFVEMLVRGLLWVVGHVLGVVCACFDYWADCGEAEVHVCVVVRVVGGGC